MSYTPWYTGALAGGRPPRQHLDFQEPILSSALPRSVEGYQFTAEAAAATKKGAEEAARTDKSEGHFAAAVAVAAETVPSTGSGNTAPATAKGAEQR